MSTASKLLPMGYAHIYRQEIAQRASGALPESQFVDVHFKDIVRDPVATVEAVYRRLDWPFTDDVAQRVARYAESKPKGSRGEHRYSLEDAGLDPERERERFGFYVDHHGVREETT